jgi:hypothetical protein
VYLGWQFSVRQPDPGPPPRRPAPPAGGELDPRGAAAQRREEDRLSRPARLTGMGAAAAVVVFAALGATGLVNWWLGGFGLLVALIVVARCSVAVRHGRRDLRGKIEAERQRLATIRDVQHRRLAARQERHAAQYRAWQDRRTAFERQPQWYAVSLPSAIDRIDVAGGTLAGWSALLTMLAGPRLSAGGEVTVLDLTEGAVAADLLAVAGQAGIEPLVWVMPSDLPRLDLGAGLDREAFVDVLVAAAAASGDPGSASDPAQDAAILDRVLAVLGDGAGIAAVNAALRALGQVGDPRDDLRAGLLTAAQLQQLTALFGRGASDRIVIGRAWALESRLRKLDQLGVAAVRLPPSRLRVAWLSRRSGVVAGQVLGTYMTVALAHMLRQAPPVAGADRWARTVCVLGAERLAADVIDQISTSCELSGTGLILAFRHLSEPVRERLGRGNAAVAFMRLGNAQDAKAASEQIGAEHRFVLSQLTDTIGTSITDTSGDSYTSTIGTADSVSDSVSVSETAGRSRGRGRSQAGGAGPFGDFTGSVSRDTSTSTGTSDSTSITAGINTGTSWGLSTSQAVGANAALARTSQRSREFLVEPHELQQLPASAVIVSYAGPEGRQVVLADANPGIFALRSATLLSPAEADALAARGAPIPPAAAVSPVPSHRTPPGPGARAPSAHPPSGPAPSAAADSPVPPRCTPPGAVPTGSVPSGGSSSGPPSAGAAPSGSPAPSARGGASGPRTHRPAASGHNESFPLPGPPPAGAAPPGSSVSSARAGASGPHPQPAAAPRDGVPPPGPGARRPAWLRVAPGDAGSAGAAGLPGHAPAAPPPAGPRSAAPQWPEHSPHPAGHQDTDTGRPMGAGPHDMDAGWPEDAGTQDMGTAWPRDARPQDLGTAWSADAGAWGGGDAGSQEGTGWLEGAGPGASAASGPGWRGSGSWEAGPDTGGWGRGDPEQDGESGVRWEAGPYQGSGWPGGVAGVGGEREAVDEVSPDEVAADEVDQAELEQLEPDSAWPPAGGARVEPADPLAPNLGPPPDRLDWR